MIIRHFLTKVILMTNLTRRSVLSAGAAVCAASVIPSKLIAQELPMIEASDPLAIALGYHADATAVDPQKYPKRPANAPQFCSNCTLYIAENDKVGKCTAIPGKLVVAEAWCNAWIKA